MVLYWKHFATLLVALGVNLKLLHVMNYELLLFSSTYRLSFIETLATILYNKFSCFNCTFLVPISTTPDLEDDVA